jgi:hypothetical protein
VTLVRVDVKGTDIEWLVGSVELRYLHLIMQVDNNLLGMLLTKIVKILECIEVIDGSLVVDVTVYPIHVPTRTFEIELSTLALDVGLL